MNTFRRFTEAINSKADAVVALSPLNRRWLTNFNSTAGFVFVTHDSVTLGVDFRYIEAAKSAGKAGGFEVLQFDRMLEAVAELCEKHGAETVGYEESYMTVAAFKRFKEALGRRKYVGVSGMFDDLRRTKEPFETERIAHAAKITDDAFSYALGLIKSGMTERQLQREIDMFFIRNGADGNAFESIVLSGANTSRPHGVPGDKPFKTGELVLMDIGCKYDGYCSDMTRTVALGYIKDEAVNAYNTVLAAQEIALNSIKSGEKAAVMDKAARDIITMAGFGENFGHSLGHGVGLEIHEYPTLSTRSAETLRSGDIVTVEPGVYLEGKFGIRIEDMVMVEDSGIRNFTTSKKQLIVV